MTFFVEVQNNIIIKYIAACGYNVGEKMKEMKVVCSAKHFAYYYLLLIKPSVAFIKF